MLAVLTGIPGTGKTTTAVASLDILKSEGIDYDLVTYGTVMFEIAREKGLVADRDEMRKLAPGDQREIQKEAARKISAMSAEKNVLLDTHCTISTPKGYLPGLPEWVLRELKPDIFILVEAKNEDIWMRRNADPTRKRDADSIDSIRTHQEINRYISAAYSMLSGCTVNIVENPQGRMEEAAKNMAKILR